MNISPLSPPKADLVLRVGVTGHRPNHLTGSNEPLLRARIQSVLRMIATVADTAQATAGTAYAPVPPKLRIVSALAEGTDQMVAEEALSLHYELLCPLPFARDDYARDFTTGPARRAYETLLAQATAVLELVNGGATPQVKNEAYEAAGRVMLRQSDLLITIWNGEPPTGRGGTGQITQEALRQQIPCVWIHADAPHALCVLTEADLTNTGAITEAAHARLSLDDPLAALVQRLLESLQPPPSPSVSGHKYLPFSSYDPHPRQDYFAETQPRWVVFGVGFKLLRNLLMGRWRIPPLYVPDCLQETAQDWQNSCETTPEFPAAVDHAVKKRFCHHYAWADKLAEYYADLYRSSFVLNYLLSAGAVGFALLSFAWGGLGSGAADHSAILSPAVHTFDYFVAGELVLILTIIMTLILGQRGRWHERWLDYRTLAESFRQMRFLALLGHNPPHFRQSAHHTYDNSSNSWMQWHSRAVIRAAGLVSARIDMAYLEAYRDRLVGQNNSPDQPWSEIQDQMKYHEENAQCMKRMAHRLHGVGFTLFLLTLVVCTDHLIFHWIHPSFALLLAGGAPALGAALAGILIQGEFERLAKRSQAMHRSLKYWVDVVQDEKFAPTLGNLGYVTDTTAEMMMDEIMDWRVVFLEKPLGLPG